MDILQTILEIKSRLDLRKEVGDLDADKTLCIFHQEDTPSCHIYDDNSFYCFGCGHCGDVIDWIAQTRGIDDNYEIIKLLADELKISFNFKSEFDSDLALIGTYVADSHKALLADNDKAENARNWLSKIGIDIDMIKKWRIGLGKLPTPDLVKVGIQHKFVNRIIYPIRRGAFFPNIVARTMVADEKPKSLNIKGRPVIAFNEHRLAKDIVVLAEGVSDAIILENHGYAAVGLLGKRVNHLSGFGKSTKSILCLDGDVEHKEVMELGKELLSVTRPYLMKLPESEDPASMLLNDFEGFMERYNAVKPYVDVFIESLPKASELDTYEYGEVLKSIAEIVNISDVPATPIFSKAKTKGYPIADLKDALKMDISEDEDSTEPNINDEIPVVFRPSQFFNNGVLHYTIYQRYGKDNGFFPFTINSNRELEPLTEEWIQNKGFIRLDSSSPSFEIYTRWSSSSSHPFSTYAFLHENKTVNPAELFVEIRSFISKYLIFPDDKYHDLITCWIMNTYVYQCHDTVPYLYLQAMKASGKTNTLLLLHELSFNAYMMGVLTESVISRYTHANQSTLIIDEAENLGEHDDSSRHVLEALNQGYKRFAVVSKSVKDGDNWSPTSFYVYSPKALASINPIHNVLLDRCIPLLLRRTVEYPPDYEPLSLSEISKPAMELRGKLYTFGLSYANDIANHKIDPPAVMTGRVYDLWHPMMVMADVVGCTETIIELMEQVTTYRAYRDDDFNLQKSVFWAIVDCMRYYQHWMKVDNNRDFYSYNEIESFIFDDTGKLDRKDLSTIIFDLSGMADRSEDLKTEIKGDKRVTSVKLTRERVNKVSTELFGEPIDWEI